MQLGELLTKSDLEAFKQELMVYLASLLENKKGEQKEWLRSKEVRRMLNISYNTLQNLRVSGKLKGTKVGGIMYYKLSDIQALLDAGTAQ